MFKDRCPHFPTTTSPHPTLPHLPPSILPHLALSVGPLYMFFDNLSFHMLISLLSIYPIKSTGTNSVYRSPIGVLPESYFYSSIAGLAFLHHHLTRSGLCRGCTVSSIYYLEAVPQAWFCHGRQGW